jgi:hypothetical protein
MFRFIWPSGFRGEDFQKLANLGSIYGRSFIKIAHFVPIREQTWPPQAIFVHGLGQNEQSL